MKEFTSNTPTPRIPEVSEVIATLSNEISELSDRLDDLRIRLNPVLDNREHEPQKAEANMKGYNSPLANDIFDNINRVKSIKYRLTDLLDRTEL